MRIETDTDYPLILVTILLRPRNDADQGLTERTGKVGNETLLLQKLELGLMLEPQNQSWAWLDSKLENAKLERLET